MNESEKQGDKPGFPFRYMNSDRYREVKRLSVTVDRLRYKIQQRRDNYNSQIKAKMTRLSELEKESMQSTSTKTILDEIDSIKQDIATLSQKMDNLDNILYKSKGVRYNDDTLRYNIKERLNQLIRNKREPEGFISAISDKIINNPEDLEDFIERVSHNLWAIILNDMNIRVSNANDEENSRTYNLVRQIAKEEINKVVVDVVDGIVNKINKKLRRNRKISDKDFNKCIDTYNIIKLAVEKSGKDIKMPDLEEFKREIVGIYSNPLQYIIIEARNHNYKRIPALSYIYKEIVKLDSMYEESLKTITETSSRRKLYKDYLDRAEETVGNFEIGGFYSIYDKAKKVYVNPYLDIIKGNNILDKNDLKSRILTHEIMHYILHSLGSSSSHNEYTVERLAILFEAYLSPDFAERLFSKMDVIERNVQIRNPDRPEIIIGIIKGIDYSSKERFMKAGYIEGLYSALWTIRKSSKFDKDTLIAEILKRI